MSQLKNNPFLNIYNWSISMDDKKIFKLMKDMGYLKQNNETLNFFLENKFSNDNNIPKYLLEEQINIKDKILKSNYKIINFLAPTSFGKSKIMLDLMNEFDDYKFIICPTVALCNEYEIKLDILNIKNVKIFTPEKAQTYLVWNNDIKISLVVFDEFYEATSKERTSAFSNCLKFFVERTKKIILISPFGTNMKFFFDSLDILKEHKIDEISTSISATSRIINNININKNNIIYKKFFELTSKKDYEGFEYKKTEINENKKDKIIENILLEDFIDKDKLIFFTSKTNIFNFAKSLLNLNKLNKIKIEEKSYVFYILDYLEKNYPGTILHKIIELGYGYHHGKMDHFLRFLIEMAFKNNEIKWIMCNRTLSKGVNLDPDILIIENTRRISEESEENFAVEMKNLIGRAGRMTSNKFIGEIFIITKSKEKLKDMNKIISQNDEIIINTLNNNEKEDEIVDYKTASFALEKNKEYYIDKIEFNEEFIRMLKIILIKNEENKIGNFKFDILVKNIDNILNINWSKNFFWFEERIKYVRAFFENTGYSWIYKNKINYNENNKIISNKSNDDILADINEKYEKFIGFYFKKILIILLEIAYIKNLITKEDYLKALEQENIEENNNMPESFQKALSRNMINKKNLDEIIDKYRKKI
ncbi:MAG: hypothetical protein ACRDA7_01270 [Metamycoplasmataceae bacterium]